MIKNISNLGDAALYCDFGTEVNKDINSKVIKLFETIREKNIEGINNLTPSYNKLIISFDLKITNFKKIKEIVENIEIKETQKLNSEIGLFFACLIDCHSLAHCVPREFRHNL